MDAHETATDPRRRPGRAIVVVLAILLVTWFAFPAGVVTWVEDHCDGGRVCDAALAAANGMDGLSRHLGVAGFLEDEREETRRDLGIEGY